MNETMQELTRLDGENKSLEAQALQHEQSARDCRAKREQNKMRQSELRRVMNDAAIVAHIEGAGAAADSARQAAEAAKTEAQAVVERLKSREATLAEQEKRIDEKLAQLKPAPELTVE